MGYILPTGIIFSTFSNKKKYFFLELNIILFNWNLNAYIKCLYNFRCSLGDCSSEFLTKMNLENHIIKAHSHEADKICSKCNKKFQAAWLKNQHEEIVHNGSLIYKCFYQDCNKTFSSSSKLQRHNKIHFKVKNFKCDVCNAEFNRREHLNNHKHFHSSVKLFKCDFLSKLFIK